MGLQCHEPSVKHKISCEWRAGRTLSKELDAAGKKEILNLIYKKIIINKSGGGALNSRISPSLFEPFENIHSKSSFLLKEREKCDVISSKRTDAP